MVCRSRVAEGNCVAERRGGEQPEANRQSVGVRIRFGVNPWRACWISAKPGTTEGAKTTDKAAFGRIAWLGSEWREGKADMWRDPSCGVRAAGGAASKTAPREGRQGVGCERFGGMQQPSESARLAKQGREAAGVKDRQLWWAEASIWTDRMVSALGNGVKGGKWFSLVDKAIRLETLNIAWEQVERNKGSSGIDGVSVERFAAGAERYLAELHESLKSGQYRPSPVKRVDIPK